MLLGDKDHLYTIFCCSDTISFFMFQGATVTIIPAVRYEKRIFFARRIRVWWMAMRGNDKKPLMISKWYRLHPNIDWFMVRIPSVFLGWLHLVSFCDGAHTKTHFTPGNPFTHLEKIQRPPCDIHVENVRFGRFNRYVLGNVSSRV